MTSPTDLVQLELTKLGRGRDRVAIIRLNRPAQLNPIDWDTVRALDAHIDTIDGERHLHGRRRHRRAQVGFGYRAHVSLRRLSRAPQSLPGNVSRR